MHPILHLLFLTLFGTILPPGMFAQAQAAYGLHFNGENQYAILPNPLISNDFTIEVAFQAEPGKQENIGRTLITNLKPNNADGIWLGLNRFGRPTLAINGHTFLKSSKKMDLRDGNCHLLTLVTDGGANLTDFTLLLDGELIGTIHAPAHHLFLNDFHVGGSFFPLQMNNAGQTVGFKGNISEVSVWGVALSLTQIRNNHHLILTGNETNLAGLWSFEEGSGQILYDKTPNAGHGWLGNAQTTDFNDPDWDHCPYPVLPGPTVFQMDTENDLLNLPVGLHFSDCNQAESLIAQAYTQYGIHAPETFADEGILWINDYPAPLDTQYIYCTLKNFCYNDSSSQTTLVTLTIFPATDPTAKMENKKYTVICATTIEVRAGDYTDCYDLIPDLDAWEKCMSEKGAIDTNPNPKIAQNEADLPVFSTKKPLLYPNPVPPATSPILRLPQKSANEIRIFDITGALLWANTITKGAKSDEYALHAFDGLPAGVYFIQVGWGSEWQTEKVIKL